MDLDKYFITTHSGKIWGAFSVTPVDGQTIPIFSCRVCFALTVEPEEHAGWHEGK